MSPRNPAIRNIARQYNVRWVDYGAEYTKFKRNVRPASGDLHGVRPGEADFPGGELPSHLGRYPRVIVACEATRPHPSDMTMFDRLFASLRNEVADLNRSEHFMTIKRMLANMVEQAIGARIMHPWNIGFIFEEQHLRRFLHHFEVDCVFDVGDIPDNMQMFLRTREGTGAVNILESNAAAAAMSPENLRRTGIGL